MSALHYISASSLDPAKHTVYQFDGNSLGLASVTPSPNREQVELAFLDGETASLHSGTLVRVVPKTTTTKDKE